MTTMHVTPVGGRSAGRALAHLDALTVTQRQVFVLHGPAGLSLGETAYRTGLGPDAVRAIYAGAAQRITDVTAVVRRSPENPSDRTKNPSEQGLCAPAQDSAATPPPADTPPTGNGAADCPPWCRGCSLEADGVRYHLSHGKVCDDYTEGEQPELCLSRLDDDGQPGTVMVELCLDLKANASLTPAQALAFAERLREFALTAASATGVEVPAEQVRVGEEIETAAGWRPVESLMVDGTAEHLTVYTAEQDLTGHSFTPGDLVRVRRAVTA